MFGFNHGWEFETPSQSVALIPACFSLNPCVNDKHSMRSSARRDQKQSGDQNNLLAATAAQSHCLRPNGLSIFAGVHAATYPRVKLDGFAVGCHLLRRNYLINSHITMLINYTFKRSNRLGVQRRDSANKSHAMKQVINKCLDF